MGSFSFITQDTKKSIWSDSENKDVHLIAPDGTVWTECSYSGYGVFGGKDIYELIAEINDCEVKTREFGIRIAFNDGDKQYPNGDNPNIIWPNLLQESKKYDSTLGPIEGCPHQGWSRWQ